jgi:hypothetical protein
MCAGNMPDNASGSTADRSADSAADWYFRVQVGAGA